MVDVQPCSGRFTPVKRVPGTHWVVGWVGPRAGLAVLGNRQVSFPCWDPNPRRPIHSLVTTLSIPCDLGSSVWMLWRRQNLMVVVEEEKGEYFQFYTWFVEICGTACCRKFLILAGNHFWSLLGTVFQILCLLSLYHNLCTNWGILVQLALL